MKGKVKNFNSKRGFGFILGEDNQDYFFHYSSLKMEGFKTVKIGATVSFEPGQTDRGLSATEIEVLAEEKKDETK